MNTQTGDLLVITRGILCHQVNCIGATGGLAGALRRKWPLAFYAYFQRVPCYGQNLGTSVIGRAPPSVWPELYIAHVFGQLQPGANTDLEAVDSALAELAKEIARHPELSALPIFVPHLMGCGLGGGRWDQYLPLLEKHLPSAIVIKLPESPK